MTDPAPGVYRLSMAVPREGTFAMQTGVWMLRSDWDVSLFNVDGDDALPRDDAQWDALFASQPLERRREPTLAYLRVGMLEMGYGPMKRPQFFAVSATTTLRVPPGRYNLRIYHDGACRARVDGQMTYDGWAAKPARPAVLEIADAPRKLEVRWARGTSQCSVYLEPIDPAAGALVEAEEPPFYDLDTNIERLTALAGKPAPSLETLVQLGEHLARRGRVKDADDAFARAVAAYPDAHWAYFNRASLAAHRGDRQAHQDLCREMLRRFADASALELGERTSKAWLMVPDSGYDLAECHRLIDKAIADGPPNYLRWFKASKGLAEYRSGNYESAVQCLEESKQMRPQQETMILSDYVIALSLKKLGRIDEAKAAFLRAEQDYANLPRLGEAPIRDNEWFLCDMIRREAAAVFASK
jgi:tetratricopeptide (TPR) repeat protein